MKGLWYLDFLKSFFKYIKFISYFNLRVGGWESLSLFYREVEGNVPVGKFIALWHSGFFIFRMGVRKGSLIFPQEAQRHTGKERIVMPFDMSIEC